MGAMFDAVRFLAAATSFGIPKRRIVRASPDPYELVAALVRHIGADELRSDELGAVLAAAEELLESPVEVVRALVVNGVLEDLMLLASYPDTALDWALVVSSAGPGCRRELDRLDQLWLTVWSSLRADGKHPTVKDYLELSGAARDYFRTAHRAMPDGQLIGVADVLRWEVARP